MIDHILTLPDGSELLARRIRCDDDALVMGRIRNACAAGFSNDTSQISEADQLTWWRDYSVVKNAWLYLTGRGLHPVGYGLLRAELDNLPSWHEVSSVAVLPEYGGRGYGKVITAHLIRRSSCTKDDGDILDASARLDNPAAMKLHRSEDWIETGRDDRLAYYRVRDAVLVDDERPCDLYTLAHVSGLGIEELRPRFAGWIGAVFARSRMLDNA